MLPPADADNDAEKAAHIEKSCIGICTTSAPHVKWLFLPQTNNYAMM